MIKAKAHRETKASAPGYDDYVEREPKSGNRGAIGFLLFVMGCVAFIKSCIPFSAGQPAEKEKPKEFAAKQDDAAAPPDAPPPEADQAAAVNGLCGRSRSSALFREGEVHLHNGVLFYDADQNNQADE